MMHTRAFLAGLMGSVIAGKAPAYPAHDAQMYEKAAPGVVPVLSLHAAGNRWLWVIAETARPYAVQAPSGRSLQTSAADDQVPQDPNVIYPWIRRGSNEGSFP